MWEEERNYESFMKSEGKGRQGRGIGCIVREMQKGDGGKRKGCEETKGDARKRKGDARKRKVMGETLAGCGAEKAGFSAGARSRYLSLTAVRNMPKYGM